MLKHLIALILLLLPAAAQCQFTQTVDGKEVLILTHKSQVDKSLQKAGDVEVESKAFKKRSFAEQLNNIAAEALKHGTNIVLITHSKSNPDGSSSSLKGVAYKTDNYELAKTTAMAEKTARAKGDGVVRFYRFDVNTMVAPNAYIKVDGKSKLKIEEGQTVDIPVTTAHNMRMKLGMVKKYRDVKPGDIYYVNVVANKGNIVNAAPVVINATLEFLVPFGHHVDKDLLLRGEWFGEIEYNLGMRQ